MHPLDFPLLADENIAPAVVVALRARGCDVAGVAERGLAGRSDREVLRLAVAEGRVVLTHDGDFGTLAVRAGAPLIGIVYLRPGHIDPEEVIRRCDALLALPIRAEPPFVVVAERRGLDLKVRRRHLR